MFYGYKMEIADISSWIPIILPIFMLHFILACVALWDLFRKDPSTETKWKWIPIIAIFSIFGPLLYFIIGKREY